MWSTFFTYFAVYFIIWWVCLFTVLSIGNQSQAEAGTVADGTEPGAPVNPRLGYKFLLNTVISLVVLGVYIVVTRYFGWSLDDLPNPIG